MNDDFPFDDIDDTTDLTSGFDEIDEFDDDFSELVEAEIIGDSGTVNMRTAILAKNHMVALLCIKTAENGGAICRIDPRETQPAVQVYDDAEKAHQWFNKSLRTSKVNGWQIAYDGLPLMG